MTYEELLKEIDKAAKTVITIKNKVKRYEYVKETLSPLRRSMYKAFFMSRKKRVDYDFNPF